MTPKWTTVRGIGNSVPSKISLLIPIAGFLILQDDRVVTWLQSNEATKDLFKPNIAENRSLAQKVLEYKFHLIYFGAHIYGVASCLYYAFCPTLAKKYQTPEEFVMALEQITTKRDLRNYLREMDTGTTQQSFEGNSLDLEMALNQISSNENDESSQSDTKIDIMKRYFETINASSPGAAFMAFALYVLALFVLAVPSIATFTRMAYSAAVKYTG